MCGKCLMKSRSRNFFAGRYNYRASGGIAHEIATPAREPDRTAGNLTRWRPRDRLKRACQNPAPTTRFESRKRDERLFRARTRRLRRHHDAPLIDQRAATRGRRATEGGDGRAGVKRRYPFVEQASRTGSNDGRSTRLAANATDGSAYGKNPTPRTRLSPLWPGAEERHASPRSRSYAANAASFGRWLRAGWIALVCWYVAGCSAPHRFV